jgi:hypothetical protein
MDLISCYQEITSGFVKEINKITSIIVIQMLCLTKNDI